MSVKYQKGISLYLAVVILSVVLAIVLGLTAVLVGQLKMIRGVENSVIAFYGADTGVELALKDAYSYLSDMVGNLPPSGNDGFGHYDLILEHGTIDVNVDVDVICCDSGTDCFDWGVGSNPLCPVVSSPCSASYFCIRSVGEYNNTKRAIEISL